MAKIEPFTGIRPDPDRAKEIASPPYDVVSREEAGALISRNPHSFLRVLRPEVELDAEANPERARLDEVARTNWNRLVDGGAMLRDTERCLYLYELTVGDHRQVGVVAGASIDEYEQGLIKKHEHTRERELRDRVRHMEALGVQPGPVFLTYRARPEIDRAVDEITRTDPVYAFEADDGVTHRFWVVGEGQKQDALVRMFGEVEALYVADGHHRSAASAEVRRRRRVSVGAGAAEAPTSSPYDHFLSVLFPHDQIRIMPYNRVIRSLGDISPADLCDRASACFDIAATAPSLPDRPGCFGMYLDGRWYRLTAKAGSYDRDDPAAALDVALLHGNLIEPLLGIVDVRNDPRIEFAGGTRALEQLQARADEGGGVAFTLHPTSIEEVMTIADLGGVMPPKSTWFEPKLRSGMVVRPLD